MRIGIISDIHGNLEALLKVINYFEKEKLDKIIICGDVIGYGPDPDRCIDLVGEISEVILKGNHEEGIINNDLSRFKQYAKLSLEITKKEIEEKINILKNWRDFFSLENVFFVHASLTDKFYKYILSEKDVKSEFEIFEKEICFLGHTHIPCIFKKELEKDKIEKLLPDFSGKYDIVFENNCKYIVNVGSVGFPRDGFPFACVGIYDFNEKRFKLERIEYPVEKTLQKINKKGLPSKIGYYLRGF